MSPSPFRARAGRTAVLLASLALIHPLAARAAAPDAVRPSAGATAAIAIPSPRSDLLGFGRGRGGKRQGRVGPQRLYFALTGVGQSLVTSPMSGTYGSLGGARLDVTWWFTRHWGLGPDIAFTGGSGKVEVTDARVQVEKNTMSLLSVPMMYRVLYSPRDIDKSPDAFFYYGLAVGLVENDDRIELRAVEASLDTIDVREDGMSESFAVAAIAGYQFHLLGRLHGAVEARWVQAGPGKFEDLGDPQGPEEEQIHREFEAMIHRPGYSVSGPEFDCGLVWRY